MLRYLFPAIGVEDDETGMPFATNRVLKERKIKLSNGELLYSIDPYNENTQDVSYCIRLDDFVYRKMDSSSFLTRIKQLKPKHILFEIHGFNSPSESCVLQAEMTNMQRLFDGMCSAHDKVLIIPLIWPTWKQSGPFEKYDKDVNTVDTSHVHFIPLFEDIVKWKSALKGVTFHLLSHSLGNRMLQNILNEFHTRHPEDKNIFQTIFLTAADIDYDALYEGKKGHAITLLAENVIVYFANTDRAIQFSGSYAFNGITRLGHNGPPDYTTIPNVRGFDCTAFNHDYDYYYVGQQKVTVGHTYFITTDNQNCTTSPAGIVCQHVCDTILSRIPMLPAGKYKLPLPSDWQEVTKTGEVKSADHSAPSEPTSAGEVKYAVTDNQLLGKDGSLKDATVEAKESDMAKSQALITITDQHEGCTIC